MVTATDVWEYQYDALGNRTATIYNGIPTYHIIDPAGLGNLAAEYDENGSLMSNYVHGLGLISSTKGNGESTYYTFDGTGNTTGVTDVNGQAINLVFILGAGHFF